MPSKSESWGIEVGAQAIKAVHLARSGSGAELIDFEVLPYSQVLTAPEVDADAEVQKQLEALIAKHDLSKTQTVVSVPGHLSFARFASLPPVDAKKLPQIVRYEAAQQIPFPIDEVEWDYQVFQQDDNPDVRVGIFAITKERVLSFLNAFRRLDIRVDQLTLSSLAAYNALTYDEPVDEEEGVIYMDVGARHTDLIFVEGGGMWIRTLPVGGSAFTQSIAKQFNIKYPKAEALKREAATSKYARQISQAIRGDLANLQQEVQRSIGYYQSLNRDANITKLVGIGSTFRLPGLRSFLAKNLDIEVVKPTGFKRIAMDGPRSGELSNAALNIAPAYGLALQGIDLQQVDCNVLPAFMLNSRMWKAKQPWFAAAAACLAGAAGLSVVSYVGNKAAFDAGEPQTTSAKAVAAQGNALKGELSSAQSESRIPLIENYLRLIDYRDVPIKIYEDVALAARETGRPGDLDDPLNRFYVEWIDTAYQPQLLAEAGEAEDPAAGQRAGVVHLGRFETSQTADAFFAAVDTPAGGAAGPADDAEDSDDASAADDGAPVRGPRYRVTVSIIAPMVDPAQALSRGFITWLARNAERPDRPYRVLIDPTTAVLSQDRLSEIFDPVEDGEGATGGRTTGGSSRGGFSRGNPGAFGGFDGGDFGDPPGPGSFGDFGDPPGPGGIGGGVGGGTGGSRAIGALSEMLPDRPKEMHPYWLGGPNVVRYIVQWEVELLPPPQSREAFNNAARNVARVSNPSSPAPTTPTPETDSTAAAAVTTPRAQEHAS